MNRGVQQAVAQAIRVGERIATALEALATTGESQSWQPTTPIETGAPEHNIPPLGRRIGTKELLDELLGSGLLDPITVAQIVDVEVDEERQEVHIRVYGEQVYVWAVDA